MATDALLRVRREEVLRMAARSGARSAGLFGSVGRGRASGDSDVDLLMALEPWRSMLDQGCLVNELEEPLGRKVDVISRAVSTGSWGVASSKKARLLWPRGRVCASPRCWSASRRSNASLRTSGSNSCVTRCSRTPASATSSPSMRRPRETTRTEEGIRRCRGGFGRGKFDRRNESRPAARKDTGVFERAGLRDPGRRSRSARPD